MYMLARVAIKGTSFSFDVVKAFSAPQRAPQINAAPMPQIIPAPRWGYSPTASSSGVEATALNTFAPIIDVRIRVMPTERSMCPLAITKVRPIARITIWEELSKIFMKLSRVKNVPGLDKTPKNIIMANSNTITKAMDDPKKFWRAVAPFCSVLDTPLLCNISSAVFCSAVFFTSFSSIPLSPLLITPFQSTLRTTPSGISCEITKTPKFRLAAARIVWYTKACCLAPSAAVGSSMINADVHQVTALATASACLSPPDKDLTGTFMDFRPIPRPAKCSLLISIIFFVSNTLKSLPNKVFFTNSLPRNIL